MTAEIQPPMERQALSENLAHFLDEGYVKPNPPEFQLLALAIYRLLVVGAPVSPAALEVRTGMTTAEIEPLLAAVPATAMERDGEGNIVSFIGLSLAPTRHKFLVGEQTLYSWCCFDALFLPELIGLPAFSETSCPATGANIRIHLSPSKLELAEPPETVLSIMVPDAREFLEDLRGTFCCHVNFFASPEAYDGWAKDRKGFARLSLEEAFEFARMRNANRFQDVAWASSAPRQP